MSNRNDSFMKSSTDNVKSTFSFSPKTSALSNEWLKIVTFLSVIFANSSTVVETS